MRTKNTNTAMTYDVKRYIASVLMTNHPTGEDRILPIIYVVRNRPYWFYFAALRAAYNDPKQIEVMNAAEAYAIHTGKPAKMMPKALIDTHIDQRGSLFNKYLYCDSEVMPNSGVY